MFNSHSDYVSWVRGGDRIEYFDESAGYVTTYSRILDTPQQVTVTTNGTIQSWVVQGGAILQEFSRYNNGELAIYLTEITFLGSFLVLAAFLALQIDWKSRISWSLYVVSDAYTFPYTTPVFTDGVSVEWIGIPPESLSSGLSSL